MGATFRTGFISGLRDFHLCQGDRRRQASSQPGDDISRQSEQFRGAPLDQS